MADVAPLISAGTSLMTLIATLAITIILALRKESVSAKDQAAERRLASLEAGSQQLRALIDSVSSSHAAQMASTKDLLHADQLETVRLQGNVRALEAQHHGFVRDLSEIKTSMVHREEWEAGNAGLHKRFDDLWALIQKLPGARSSSSGAYSHLSPTSGRPPTSSSPPPPRPR